MQAKGTGPTVSTLLRSRVGAICWPDEFARCAADPREFEGFASGCSGAAPLAAWQRVCGQNGAEQPLAEDRED